MSHTAMDVQVQHDILTQSTTDDLIASIDQGTSSTRFVLFTGSTARIAVSAQIEHSQIFYENQDDKVGWHEQDPAEIWMNTAKCMQAAMKALDEFHASKKSGGRKFQVRAIGITNQRETTVAWNAVTGKPYYAAIVWDDTRTAGIAGQLGHSVDHFRARTGLPLASYFAGTKVKWLLDNVPQLATDVKERPEEVRFGTIDTWLLYQLTGKSSEGQSTNVGGIFVTDVTNASRWLFLDLKNIYWSQDLVDELCEPHFLPIDLCLPKICPSSHVYANFKPSESMPVPVVGLDDVPLASVVGDQQAALLGQGAFQQGQAKNTYGTGMFLMMNTGDKPIPSHHGLITTIAFQLGSSSKVQYALEGSVSHSGSTIQWLRDQLCILESAPQSEKLATAHNEGLYFVPAFAGLFAPHWRSDARGCIVGLAASHHKGHVVRAALEAAAYQAREVLDAMLQDAQASMPIRMTSLQVDGGGSRNGLLMQFQADMLGIRIERPSEVETTARGAALAAGLAVGVYKSVKDIKSQIFDKADASTTWTPTMSEEEREINWKGWQKAVLKSMNWIDIDDDETVDEVFVDALMDSIPPKSSFLDIIRDWSPTIFVAVTGVAAGFVLGRQKAFVGSKY